MGIPNGKQKRDGEEDRKAGTVNLWNLLILVF